MDVLRSQSRVSLSSMAGRYRQSADLENAGNFLLRGSQWHSDGVYLVSHHNGAMRKQNPSRLDKLPPEPEIQIGQKKKKRHAEDDGDHRLHDTYASDASLHALRDLRLKHFPSEEATRAAEDLEEKKKAVVSNLKANLQGHFLENFRGPDGFRRF